MNKIDKLFTEKRENILSVYFTAGFPKLNDTAGIIAELEQCGVDMVEIGMPFSDPLADGPTIQKSSEQALKNGMSIPVLFEQLRDLNVKVPIVLMGYLNPVLQYGVEKFCRDAKTLGIAGVILPDLPLQEYLDEYHSVFEKYELKNIFLITPQTSDERIRLIDQHSDGFIYVVAFASTTGTKNGIDSQQEIYFRRIQQLKLKSPTLIGFGISDQETFSTACKYANGAIVGSAFINSIKESMDLSNDISGFVNNLLEPQVR